MIFVATCEIAGRVRGKGFPASDLPARLKSGVGWVPTNTMISAFGRSPTRLRRHRRHDPGPDPDTEVNVNFGDGGAPEHWFLGDIRLTDGTPWKCCPRNFLRRALAALDDAAGLKLATSAFEQESMYDGVDDRPGSPFSLDAWRRQAFSARSSSPRSERPSSSPIPSCPNTATGNTR